MPRTCGECGLPRDHWIHDNPSLGPRQILHKYVAARPTPVNGGQT